MGRSIMVVEDEELIRKGIIARLDYLGFIFDAVIEADNGGNALELLKKQKVDIIITDIEMSNMDGLKMLSQVKELYSDIEFVILSGYAEFAYAEEAIRLGVNAYLLKPVSNAELKKIMQQMLEKLDKSQEEKQQARQSVRTSVENKKMLFEKKINEILWCSDADRARQIFLKSGLSDQFFGKYANILVAVIGIDAESYQKQKFDYQDVDLIRFAIKNIFDELAAEHPYCIVSNLTDSNQMYAILSGGSGAHTKQEAERLRQEAGQIFAMLGNMLWKYIEITITIGVSSVGENLFAESLREAQEAFLQRVIHGRGNLFFYDDIKILTAERFPVSELHMLKQYIERHDLGNIQFILNEILSDERVSQYNVSYIRVMWVRILNILLRTSNAEGGYSAKQLEHMLYRMEQLAGYHSVEEIRKYLYEVILKGMEEEGKPDINSKDKIRMAILYIEENYNRDIAINELAERFFMSPNYFSTVFKKETGQAAVNYIKIIRLSKAKEYLEKTDKSAVDIAKEVGYEDSQYFFKLFKKETGMTPLQYRKSIQSNYGSKNH